MQKKKKKKPAGKKNTKINKRRIPLEGNQSPLAHFNFSGCGNGSACGVMEFSSSGFGPRWGLECVSAAVPQRRRLLFPGAASVIKLRPPFKRGVVGPSRLGWGQRARTGAGEDT